MVRSQARGPHSELEAAEEALGAAGRHLWVRERIRLHHRALARRPARPSQTRKSFGTAGINMLDLPHSALK